MIRLTAAEENKQLEAKVEFGKNPPDLKDYLLGHRVIRRYKDSPPLKPTLLSEPSPDYVLPEVPMGVLIYELQWPYVWKLVEAKSWRQLNYEA